MDSTKACAGASIFHPRSYSSAAGNVNSSCSIAPPPGYDMLVRLTNRYRWIAIRELGRARLWKLVKVPRVPRSVILSIFPSSVNRRGTDADNQPWPPLGWRAIVGQDDRLEASATVKGLRDPLPIAGFGESAVGRHLAPARRSRAGTVVLAIGRCPASAVPNHQGIITHDSIETSTDNLSLHKRTSR